MLVLGFSKILLNIFAFQLSLGYSKTNALNHKKAGVDAELPPAPVTCDEKKLTGGLQFITNMLSSHLGLSGWNSEGIIEGRTKTNKRTNKHTK